MRNLLAGVLGAVALLAVTGRSQAEFLVLHEDLTISGGATLGGNPFVGPVHIDATFNGDANQYPFGGGFGTYAITMDLVIQGTEHTVYVPPYRFTPQIDLYDSSLLGYYVSLVPGGFSNGYFTETASGSTNVSWSAASPSPTVFTGLSGVPTNSVSPLYFVLDNGAYLVIENGNDIDVDAMSITPLAPTVTGVPEPSSLALLGMGATCLLGYLRRRRLGSE